MEPKNTNMIAEIVIELINFDHSIIQCTTYSKTVFDQWLDRVNPDHFHELTEFDTDNTIGLLEAMMNNKTKPVIFGDERYLRDRCLDSKDCTAIEIPDMMPWVVDFRKVVAARTFTRFVDLKSVPRDPGYPEIVVLT